MKNLVTATQLIYAAASDVAFWHTLSIQDIRQRYRRSTIGPFWLTITTGIQIATMGILVGYLLQQDFGKFLPYVCAGLIMWNLMSTVLNEGAMVFISYSPYLLQTRRPHFVYVMVVLWRNILIATHTIVIYVFLAFYYDIVPSWHSLYLLPAGLLLISLNLSWISMFLGIVSARFRDIPQMVQSSLTVLFWLTPIIYYPSQLGSRRLIVDLNPLTHFMALIRDPIMGTPIDIRNWIFAIVFAAIGWTISIILYSRCRGRINFWI